jgi:hypothetical protein
MLCLSIRDDYLISHLVKLYPTAFFNAIHTSIPGAPRDWFAEDIWWLFGVGTRSSYGGWTDPRVHSPSRPLLSKCFKHSKLSSQNRGTDVRYVFQDHRCDRDTPLLGHL